MREFELNTSRETIIDHAAIKRTDELEKWFRFEYPARLNKINTYSYLGLKCDETRWDLEIEAYNKENELRIIEGKEPLPEIKYKSIL